MGRNVWVAHGESLDVELIDRGIVPRDLGWRIRLPGESGVDHSVLGHSKGIIAPVKRQVRFTEPADPQRSNELELLAGQLEVKPSPADQYFTSDIV